jgi:hypothetical protein
MTIDDWFRWAADDAARRGLSTLKPLLESLHRVTRELRDGDWNDDAAAPAADAPAPETSAQ